LENPDTTNLEGPDLGCPEITDLSGPGFGTMLPGEVSINARNICPIPVGRSIDQSQFGRDLEEDKKKGREDRERNKKEKARKIKYKQKI
jgi:hypothetical protein